MQCESFKFDALLKELGGSFADGFDNCFHQVPDLDLSHVSIDVQAKTLAQLVYFEGTNELFADKTNPDPQGDGDAVQVDQEKFVKDVARHLKGDQTVEKKIEDTPVVQS